MTQTIEQLIERLNAVREGMEAGLDDWPTASQIWEYREAVKAIEQLTARVRELKEENARLGFALADTEALELRTSERLAASQAYAEQLRVALQTFIDEHEECTDADDWMAMLCSIEAHHVAQNE